MKKDYQKNAELAISQGFEEVCDEKAYEGRYYIKDGLIWIHDIEALKTSLNIDEDEELRHEGYDINSYYYYIGYREKGVVNKELALDLIKALIHSDDSALSHRFDLLKNKDVLNEMVSLFCEGYREEALINYANQVLKK